MSLTYAEYITTIANIAVQSESDADFIQIMPQTIDYAEGRIYRELDLLSTVVRDSSGTCTANSRTFTLPQSLGRFETVNSINIVTPSSATISSTGTRNPVTAAKIDALDWLWPAETAASATTVPTLFAPLTDQIYVFGPPPGATFQVEVIGNIIPTPLSSTNTTTYLSLYLPDLFIAASMIFISGWMRNFGAGADNPQMAMSWDAQYDKLFASANLVDVRQKFASSNWTSNQPSPLAKAS